MKGANMGKGRLLAMAVLVAVGSVSVAAHGDPATCEQERQALATAEAKYRQDVQQRSACAAAAKTCGKSCKTPWGTTTQQIVQACVALSRQAEAEQRTIVQAKRAHAKACPTEPRPLRPHESPPHRQEPPAN